MFGPEDRAPHGFFFACGRWYADKLNARLGETGAFVVETSTRDAILGGLRSFNDSLGLKHHDRLPYLYGAWKAKKKAFRFQVDRGHIAGAGRNAAGGRGGPGHQRPPGERTLRGRAGVGESAPARSTITENEGQARAQPRRTHSILGG